MKRSLVSSAASAVALLFLGLNTTKAQTLLYSFETIVPSGLAAPNDGSGPDGFVPNDGGTITQDTFGATAGPNSLKYFQTDTDTFTGMQTGVGLPFGTINAATTSAVSLDLTVKAGEEFVGGFASLGITEFGTFVDPDLGPLGGQAQTIAASEQNIKLAAGTYRFVIPLIARTNQHTNSGRPNVSFNGVFESDPLGTLSPTAFQFYINKGATTGVPPVNNASLTIYVDNVRALNNVAASWRSGANGNWSTDTNWFGMPAIQPPAPGSTSVSPNGVDAIAQFGLGQITGAIIATVDTPKTVGTIFFNAGNSYTIGGTSTLTLDVSSGQSTIHTYNGTHFISAPVLLNDDLNLNVMGNGSLTISSNVTATGKTITKSGAGPVQMENVRASALNVTGGSVRISAKPTPNDPTGTSVVNSLAIAAGAQLDLINNSAIIDYTGPVGSLVDDVRQHLQSGRLTTSAVVAGQRNLGYGDNSIAFLNKSSFGGQTVDASSLLIKYTYLGDLNLDGQVDITDLGRLATFWQTNGPWTSGDLDYNNFVDITDLGALATNWQAGVGSPLGPDSLNAALAALGLPGAAVPEPATILLTALPGAMILHRARRRRYGGEEVNATTL